MDGLPSHAKTNTYNVTRVHSQQKSKGSISGSDQPPSFSL